MALDGIQHGNRVQHFSTPREAAMIVDAILDSSTLACRFMRMGKPFNSQTILKTIKVEKTEQGQFFRGLTTLNSAAVDTTIQIEFSHNLYQHAIVDIMDEAFARSTPDQTIDEYQFRKEEAIEEMIDDLAEAFYGTGAGEKPLGLEAIVDDGTNVSTYGGQSRSTYSQLNATSTASGGDLSLSKMGALFDDVADTGRKEMPTLFATTWDIWTLYESLLNPTVVSNAQNVGYQKLGIQDSSISRPAELKGGLGFTVLTYRGIPILRDKACPAQTMYLLNENYLNWYGRTKTPAEYKSFMKKVNLGKTKVIENQPNKPSSSHGFFYQNEMMMPNKAGIIARMYAVGQLLSTQPRRLGKLTGITGVA
jgi:hypothetical protein